MTVDTATSTATFERGLDWSGGLYCGTIGGVLSIIGWDNEAVPFERGRLCLAFGDQPLDASASDETCECHASLTDSPQWRTLWSPLGVGLSTSCVGTCTTTCVSDLGFGWSHHVMS